VDEVGTVVSLYFMQLGGRADFYILLFGVVYLA
jgi:hypothetical protein